MSGRAWGIPPCYHRPARAEPASVERAPLAASRWRGRRACRCGIARSASPRTRGRRWHRWRRGPSSAPTSNSGRSCCSASRSRRPPARRPRPLLPRVQRAEALRPPGAPGWSAEPDRRPRLRARCVVRPGGPGPSLPRPGASARRWRGVRARSSLAVVRRAGPGRCRGGGVGPWGDAEHQICDRDPGVVHRRLRTGRAPSSPGDRAAPLRDAAPVAAALPRPARSAPLATGYPPAALSRATGPAPDCGAGVSAAISTG